MKYYDAKNQAWKERVDGTAPIEQVYDEKVAEAEKIFSAEILEIEGMTPEQIHKEKCGICDHSDTVGCTECQYHPIIKNLPIKITPLCRI